MTRPPVGSTGTLDDLQVEPGDVVEWLNDSGAYEKGRLYTIGATGTARHSDGGWIDRVNHSASMRLISRANPDQPALQIEAGKYYRTRDGRKVGPMLEWRADVKRPFEVDSAAYGTDLFTSFWTREGASDEGTQADLIAEWNDDQPAHIITHEGRTFDLFDDVQPLFGMLPDPVQSALLSWDGVIQRWDGDWLDRVVDERHILGFSSHQAYRAKPAPTEPRVQCYRGEYYKAKEHGTCIKRDGEVLWDTWEPDA